MVLHNRVAEIEGQARIAIYLPRNNFFLASIFAIWQNGHYYIPLNKTWPDGHVEKILENAQPDLVIAEDLKFEKYAKKIK